MPQQACQERQEGLGGPGDRAEGQEDPHGGRVGRLQPQQEQVHERVKSGLERNLATLQDELACKQIEVRSRLPVRPDHDCLSLSGVLPQDECGGVKQQQGGRGGGAGRDWTPAGGHQVGRGGRLGD